MTNEITAAQQIVKRSQIQMIWNRFRKNKTAVLGLFLLSAIILIALCAPLLVDYKVDALEQNISERLLSPGSGHLLGTDQFLWCPHFTFTWIWGYFYFCNNRDFIGVCVRLLRR